MTFTGVTWDHLSHLVWTSLRAELLSSQITIDQGRVASLLGMDQWMLKAWVNSYLGVL